MALTPEQFANLYLPVRVEDEEWWEYPVTVGAYRNAKYNVDLDLKDQLLAYLKGNKNKPDTGIVSGDAGGYAIPSNGVKNFKAETLMHAFCGKALPHEAAAVISIFS